MITDKLRSYKAAKKKILKSTEHRSHKRLNNKIEVSHQPTRIREKMMRGFKSLRQAQIFPSAFGTLKSHFKIDLYKLSAKNRKSKLQEVFNVWDEVTQQPYYA